MSRHTQNQIITVVDTAAQLFFLTRVELREASFRGQQTASYRSISKKSLKSLFKRKEGGRSQVKSLTTGYYYEGLTDKKSPSFNYRMGIYENTNGLPVLSIGCKTFDSVETAKIKRWAMGEPQTI